MKQQNTMVGLVLLLLAVFGNCEDAKDTDCPSSFEQVEGIPGRCFFYYEGPTGGNITAYVSFPEALEICKGKQAKVFEPQTFEEAAAIFNYGIVKKNWINLDTLWFNYRDIEVKASFVGEGNMPVFVDSSYMGSLSTLGKLPTDWWNPGTKGGTYRDSGEHCAVLGKDRILLSTSYYVYDVGCTWYKSLVCETPAVSSNLKQDIINLNGTVATD